MKRNVFPILPQLFILDQSNVNLSIRQPHQITRFCNDILRASWAHCSCHVKLCTKTAVYGANMRFHVNYPRLKSLRLHAPWLLNEIWFFLYDLISSYLQSLKTQPICFTQNYTVGHWSQHRGNYLHHWFNYVSSSCIISPHFCKFNTIPEVSISRSAIESLNAANSATWS